MYVFFKRRKSKVFSTGVREGINFVRNCTFMMDCMFHCGIERWKCSHIPWQFRRLDKQNGCKWYWPSPFRYKLSGISPLKSRHVWLEVGLGVFDPEIGDEEMKLKFREVWSNFKDKAFCPFAIRLPFVNLTNVSQFLGRTFCLICYVTIYYRKSYFGILRIFLSPSKYWERWEMLCQFSLNYSSSVL